MNMARYEQETLGTLIGKKRKADLSEKYYYPRNCNESMRIKGCFIDFLG